jgi:hypothetical protein
MTSLGRGEKAARQRALTTARAALKGLGANEFSSGSARRVTTAKTTAVRHSKHAGIRVRNIRLRKIRIRG